MAAATRRGVVGTGAPIDTPFGPRRLAYTDWAASGRSLAPVEDYIRRCALVAPRIPAPESHLPASACFLVCRVFALGAR